MNCHVCGGQMESAISDIPFRLSRTAIVVIKRAPALECVNCGELSIEDPVMERIDGLLERTGDDAELAVVPYTAVV